MPAGFAAIGGAVLGAIGATGVGAIGTIITGIAVSAVVGAAIGGISAAVLGGDIGQGMLFGAVGGVITGGLAGGLIAPQTSAIQSSMGSLATPTLSSGGLQSAGSGMIYDVATQEVLTSAATPQVFGGGVNGGGTLMSSMFAGSGGDLIKGFGAAMMPEAEQPWAQTEEGIRAQWEQNEREMALASELSGGGSSSSAQEVPYLELEEMQQEGALNQIAAEAEENRKYLEIQGEQALASQEQEYSLANANAQEEWDRGIKKLTDAAGVASGQQYQSGQGQYEQVLAAQKKRGYEQNYNQGSALVGPQPEEGVA